jgi:FG-GAP-like repeat
VNAYLAVGDFTGNGRLDLVVFPASVSNTDTYIFFNDGSGNFPSENVCCATGALSVVVADFNNDGKLDIAESNSNGLTIWLGNGDGTFSLASSPSVGNNPDGLAAGDLNGDGKVDLVAANYTDGTVSVLLGKGDGTFTNGATNPIGKQPVAIALAGTATANLMSRWRMAPEGVRKT